MKTPSKKKPFFFNFVLGILLLSFLSINVFNFYLDFCDLELKEQIELSEKSASEKESEEKEETKEFLYLLFHNSFRLSEGIKPSNSDHFHTELIFIDVPTPPPDLSTTWV